MKLNKGTLITTSTNPYDELPYKSYSIEWTAPERLAIASVLHGGPRPPLDSYRVLELGCGTGGNLLPLAYYRRNAEFVGIDGAKGQIEIAESCKASLGISNIEFISADFRTAANRLSGKFDFMIAHGVFSWVPIEARDALLEIIAQYLRKGGLVYLNYNTRPGWNVRGLVREFLLAQTAGETNLHTRARRAVEVSKKIVAVLTGLEHPYSQLLANEFRFVGDGDLTWIAHEYLAADNHPYWRSEFLSLIQQYQLEYVADADFNYSTSQIPEGLIPQLEIEHIKGVTIEDTVDLFCYRQLHSAILTPAPLNRILPDLKEFGNLLVASCLKLCSLDDGGGASMFRHPSGYEVEAKEDITRLGLSRLHPLWPRGVRVVDLFPELHRVMDDLKLLQRNGLIELRCIEPGDFGVDGNALNKLEQTWGCYLTTPYHTTEFVKANPPLGSHSKKS